MFLITSSPLRTSPTDTATPTSAANMFNTLALPHDVMTSVADYLIGDVHYHKRRFAAVVSELKDTYQARVRGMALLPKLREMKKNGLLLSYTKNLKYDDVMQFALEWRKDLSAPYSIIAFRRTDGSWVYETRGSFRDYNVNYPDRPEVNDDMDDGIRRHGDDVEALTKNLYRQLFAAKMHKVIGYEPERIYDPRDYDYY